MSRPPDDWTIDSSGLGATDSTEVLRVLKAENDRLRERVRVLEDRASASNELVVSVPSEVISLDIDVSASSDAQLKVLLFASLFRGREDVFATRWENPDGRSGYSPALRPGILQKKAISHQAGDYLPLTPEVLRSHLSGKLTVGVYPLLSDETCWFLAMDFDKRGWQQDVLMALESCEALGIQVPSSVHGLARAHISGSFSAVRSQLPSRGISAARC